MNATAIVGGKLVRFALPPALAKAHKRNAGKTMSDQQAIDFVEMRRREHAFRRATPYLSKYSLNPTTEMVGKLALRRPKTQLEGHS